MLTLKRVLIATLCGFIFGIVCMLMASSNSEITLLQRWMIIVGRTMLGFTIGISALCLVWWQHGLVLGFLTSIPMALPLLGNTPIMIGTLVMGLIYGFLTELITSILFKAKPVGMLKAG